MKTHQPDELTTAYTASVERERVAWQALQSHAPGSVERAKAWDAWSEAIMRTNDAWRKLNARRFADPLRRTREPAEARHARA
jgi:hypothetical protein